jgi:hypothetical protein
MFDHMSIRAYSYSQEKDDTGSKRGRQGADAE